MHYSMDTLIFFHQVSTLLEIGEKSSRCINIKLQFLKTFVRDNPQ